MPSIDNLFAVGANGREEISLLIPPSGPLRLSKGEALNLAAYLVSLADPAGTKFQEVLKAIQNT